MPAPMIRQISFFSPEYAASLALRDRVLRQPLGLSLFDEDLSAETAQWHFAIFSDRLLACLVIVPLPETGVVRLRQMAVDSACQGSGLGRLLVQKVEVMLKEKSVRRVELHGRVIAQGFYEKLGYEVEGAPFMEVGIAHRKMAKNL